MKALSFVNGEWLEAKGEPNLVYNPFTQEVIGQQWFASEEDVERALAAAFHAKKEIASIPSYKRAEILKKAASLIGEEKVRLAKLITIESGKPIRYALDEVSRAVETLELSAEEAKRLTGETIQGDASARGGNAIAATFKVPAGVVVAITPFNGPLNLICHKVGPAFAAGNSMIVKPSPQTPFVARELIKILLEAGFPPNGINLVYGDVSAGQQIVKDDRINVISFTGGLKASRNICELSGMKKVLLELGGNAATIVHEDANLERAAELCAKTGFSNSGQTCISVQRIYVHQSVVKDFTRLLREKTQQYKIGDPLNQDTDVASLIDEKAAQRIKEWIQDAVISGAELIYGGTRINTVVEPTILFNPPKNHPVVCEEVFGPVVCIIPYGTIDEAVQEANDSSYGLQAGLFTNQMDLAYKVAQALEVGGVVINGTSNFRLDHFPYGGIKNSGIGRESPRYTIQEMLETKMVVFQITD